MVYWKKFPKTYLTMEIVYDKSSLGLLFYVNCFENH